MNYIRTISGIYEYDKHISIEGDILYEIVFDDPYTDYGVNGKYSRGKILNQADTIWKLCDGFYIDVNIFEKSCVYGKDEYYDFHYVITQFLNKSNIKYKAYGFIKTDKGLIYVAKMNDEGELCLI